ncbi:B-cadherin-like [Notolabrus celidotus]|uniref:B-cadherin-like n=1 Tax=Notolabrus celidotus TaxID=1203425 RepID=UPI00148F483B|nr:B-cadherin-like [Notolabrus celidotus]XP_034537165.1 B-cadherin-like [Notolabrus celidotus]
MGAAGFAVLAVLSVVLQASAELTTEEPTCLPGFEADMMIFKVNRKHLSQGRRLGRVPFTVCTEGTGYLVRSADTRFTMQRDGTLVVKRQVILHDGHVDVLVNYTDLRGRKMSVTVRIVHQGHHHGHHNGHHNGEHSEQQGGPHHEPHQGHHSGHHNGQHHEQQDGPHHGHHNGQQHEQLDGPHHGHHNGQQHEQQDGPHHGHHNGQQHEHQHQHHHKDHHEHQNGHQHKEHGNVGRHHEDDTHHVQLQELPKVDPTIKTESGTDSSVPVVIFPKSRKGLSRRKRDWVIPDINVSENDRGPYPLKVSQIRSNEDKIKKIFYSITGPGADEHPAGLFTMDRLSGNLYLTQPLDREAQDQYKFQAYAVADGSGNAEEPMEIIVNVLDQNDNKPTFEQTTFIGEVPESSPNGYEIIKVLGTDLDQPNTDNSDIRYRILSQDPVLPSDNLFVINSHTGAIRINAGGLDREKYPKYTLKVQVADMMGEGLTGEANVILTVTDSNDNAPIFTQPSYAASVPENKVGVQILTMSVTDGDEPHSPAWNAKFNIVDGDPGGLFSIKTGPNKQEGIISTAKGLDFEKISKHTLLVAVENDAPFATPLPTATATVVVTVIDVNEPPVFDPIEKTVSKKENLALEADVVQYTASDPDTARKQKVTYKIVHDPAGWLDVNKDTGLIKVKSEMDRESLFVKDNKYTALVGAIDNDEVPATGTGTLMIQLEDVNDNAPTIVERFISVCNKNSISQFLSVTDKDGPGFTSPYSVSLQGMSKSNWTARMNETKTGIILNLAQELPPGEYTVVLRVADNEGEEQDSTIQAKVCDCSGEEVTCTDRRAGGVGLPLILGILAGILLLLMLVLLLLLFARRRKGEKKEPLLQDDDVRDNIYFYDEEGGGEDDQDYDLGVLHRGLDNRPEVFRNDVMPISMAGPRFRPRPTDPEEIGNFIDDNLKAADNDPTAPPYDSLLVFDYEGGGSDAGSLSSLNSSSSGDQDYDCFSEWGPRFKKLADMYGGGEDDDML